MGEVCGEDGLGVPNGLAAQGAEEKVGESGYEEASPPSEEEEGEDGCGCEGYFGVVSRGGWVEDGHHQNINPADACPDFDKECGFGVVLICQLSRLVSRVVIGRVVIGGVFPVGFHDCRICEEVEAERTRSSLLLGICSLVLLGIFKWKKTRLRAGFFCIRTLCPGFCPGLCSVK